MERRRYGPFILVLQKKKSSSTDWLFATSGPLPSKHTQPFPHTLLLVTKQLLRLVTRPRAFLWFHHRLWWETEPPPHKSERKWGKNSNKIHADLQIEKVREREEEDSPLTKPCAHKIQHHPSNERQKKKGTNWRKSLRERTNRPVIIFAGIWG